MIKTSIYLTERQVDLLKELKDRTGQPFTSIIRNALEEHFSQYLDTSSGGKRN